MTLSPNLRSEKITPHHLERSAVVYVRQSTLQQVIDHQESTRLQYGLVDRALAFGWTQHQILVIDDDLGKSATSIQGRTGFQHLVSEVGLGHVGLILGIDMSRLARSCKDWHQLLEICALFGTLIADLDGVYDPRLFNDRLLLGLKGTMSEAELHLIKQRLHQGTRNKAARGELQFRLPTGYVHAPNGDIIFDPDPQVQQVIHLIFRKFEELTSINALLRFLAQNDIQLGMRLFSGELKGQLEWRPPNRGTLQYLLKHPIYAGAYTYGRRQADPRKQQPGRPATGRAIMPIEQWHVFIPDSLPAYISWQQYENNLAQLKANQFLPDRRGTPRSGPALLSGGLLICGICGERMAPRYPRDSNFSYCCTLQTAEYGKPRCQSFIGDFLDHWLSQQIFLALQPAALELSLAAASQIHRDRLHLDQIWQQRLERASFEADRAARHYHLVEPENRLVARQLALDWEQKLLHLQKLKLDYEHFSKQNPKHLTEQESNTIRLLSQQIPSLWNQPSTTNEHRKEIIRLLISKVVVAVQGNSEIVHASIHWNSDHISHASLTRPVANFTQLSYYPQLCDTVRSLHQQNFSKADIALQLNLNGFRPPKRRDTFNPKIVSSLLQHLGLVNPLPLASYPSSLLPHEYYLSQLVSSLHIAYSTLHTWLKKGILSARRESSYPFRWIILADDDELLRLKQLALQPTSLTNHLSWLQQRNAPPDQQT